MEYPKITRLYKYTAFSARSISALMNKKFWIPKPSTFNDPFDSVMTNHAAEWLNQSKTKLAKAHKKSQLINSADIGFRIQGLDARYMLPAYEKGLELSHQAIQDYNVGQTWMSSIGVLSLSETPKSILMWSHYGGQHSGICLEFERTPENRLGGEDAKPVIYSSKRTFDKAIDKPDYISPLFVKHSGWRYEKEWRLIEQKGDHLYDFPGELLSVICGARMTPEDKETVSLIVKSLNSHLSKKILVRQAEMSATTYSLKIKS